MSAKLKTYGAVFAGGAIFQIGLCYVAKLATLTPTNDVGLAYTLFHNAKNCDKNLTGNAILAGLIACAGFYFAFESPSGRMFINSQVTFA